MKVLLDIQDKKAAPLLEVLKGLSYVKAKPLTKSNAEFLEDASTVSTLFTIPFPIGKKILSFTKLNPFVKVLFKDSKNVKYLDTVSQPFVYFQF